MLQSDRHWWFERINKWLTRIKRGRDTDDDGFQAPASGTAVIVPILEAMRMHLTTDGYWSISMKN